MTTQGTTSRRGLLRHAALGGALGVGWAAALRAAALPDTPTLSLIGTGDSQLVLLDTLRLRVLIALGPPSPELLARLPALMTVMRQRVDLLIAPELDTALLPDAFRRRWSVAHTLVLPASPGDGASDPAWRTTVRTDLGVDLDRGIQLSLRLTSRNGWRVDGDASLLWAASLRWRGGIIALAPDTRAAAVLGPSNASLVVVPGADPGLVAEKLTPAALAMNAAHLDRWKTPASLVRLRTFRDDVSRLQLHEDGLRLPAWAEPAHSSDSERS